MTNDLLAFLNARLDEDEAAAEAAARKRKPPWRAEVYAGGLAGSINNSPEGASPARHDRGHVAEAISGTVAPHIARHDPARVLREVAAKRAVIATVFAYEAKIDGEWACCHSADEIAAGSCPETRLDDITALRELAAIWVGHPDYRDEWAS